MKSLSIGRPATARGVLGWSLATAFISSAALDAQPDAAFADLDRVTAIDVSVEVSRAKGRKGPAGLRTEDFEVLLDGQPRPVVAVSPAQTGWQTVLYFDYELAGQRTVRWAAETLAEQAEALVSRGSVEVVVADPLPRHLLLPTADAGLHSKNGRVATNVPSLMPN